MNPIQALSRSWPFFFAFVLAMATLVSACGAPDPELTDGNEAFAAGPAGRILFVSDRDVALWSGGDIEELTEYESDDSRNSRAASPSWSPAGDRFAYVEMHSEGYSDLIIAERDGDTLKRVTNNRPDVDPYTQEFVCYANWVYDPVWSPAGEQIIWVSDREGDEVFDCEGRVSDSMYLWYSETWDAPPYILDKAYALDVPQENPTLSPNGDVAAFVARVEQDGVRTTAIWTLNLNTAEATPLVEHPEGAYDPAWSPDGEHIAYVQRNGTSNDIWIAPADGGDPYQLTNIGSTVSPAWSPDGRHLAFFRLKEGEFEAWFVEVRDDGNGRLVASNPEKLFDADNIDAASGMSWGR